MVGHKAADQNAVPECGGDGDSDAAAAAIHGGGRQQSPRHPDNICVRLQDQWPRARRRWGFQSLPILLSFPLTHHHIVHISVGLTGLCTASMGFKILSYHKFPVIGYAGLAYWLIAGCVKLSKVTLLTESMHWCMACIFTSENEPLNGIVARTGIFKSVTRYTCA